jgi:hypothetical protein
MRREPLGKEMDTPQVMSRRSPMSRFRRRTNALVIALLVFGANAPCPSAESFPAATPESQGLSSQVLGKLLDVVRGCAENGDIVGGELLVIKNRRTVLHETVGLAERETHTQR